MNNLFAIVDSPGIRIRRISINRDLQNEINGMFKRQFEYFHGCVEVDFNGLYKVDGDEVLVVRQYDDIDNVLDSFENPNNYHFLEENELLSMKAIYTSWEHEGIVYAVIQHFDKTRIIEKKRAFIFSDKTFTSSRGDIVSIKDEITCLLSKNGLVFKSFFNTRKIFDMSGYLVEATDQDIKEFKNSALVSFPDDESLLDGWIRKKIAMIRSSGILKKENLDKIKLSSESFDIPIKIEGDKVVFPDDKKELKKVLRFLDEDYYESPFSNKYISNSKKRFQ